MTPNHNGPPPVFLAMPVYRGWDLLDETLGSILNQKFQDFRLLMSVDGEDERSADVCAKYTHDPRVELILHKERLGWAGNLNWLMTQCDGEYFCYWQQDDLCAPSFLHKLYRYAVKHPEASCVYSDVKWFGQHDEQWHLPSVTGPALGRVASLIENGYSEIMGLIRAAALRGAGQLRLNEFDSRLEDFVWAAKLAREGELHNVPGTLYYKRSHNANTHSFRPCPPEWSRGIWIEYGIGLLEAGLPLVSGPGRVDLLMSVLERLIVPGPKRWMIFEPSLTGPDGVISLASQFLDTARQRLCVEEWHGIRLPNSLVPTDTSATPIEDSEAIALDRVLRVALQGLLGRGAILEARLAESEADRAARLDLVHQAERQLTESESDRAARLEAIHALEADLKESEADRAARLEAIHELGKRLEESEADRALRLDSIQQLGKQLAESESDRAARLEAIHELGKRLEESEVDRAARLEAIHALECRLKESETDRAARLEAIHELTKRLEESEADRAARLEAIHALDNRLKESEADRAARLDAIHELTKRLEESEADRAARLEAIHILDNRLKESEADRAARLDAIHELTKRLEESEADRAARLEAIHALDNRLKESEADRAARLEEIQALEKRLEESESHGAAGVEALHVAAGRIRGLEADLSAGRELLQALKGQVQEIQADRDAGVRAAEDLKARLARSEADVARKLATIRSLEERLKRLEAEWAATNRKLTERLEKSAADRLAQLARIDSLSNRLTSTQAESDIRRYQNEALAAEAAELTARVGRLGQSRVYRLMRRLGLWEWLDANTRAAK